MEYHFDRIVHVETADKYLDYAFSGAKKAGDDARTSFKDNKNLSRIAKSRIAELAKIKAIRDILSKYFTQIGKSYPSLDGLPEFYKELLKLSVDVVQFKKSLAAVNWGKGQIHTLHKMYQKKIQGCTHLEQMNELRRGYYGRVSSVLKQITKDLSFLRSCKRFLKNFPVIKERMYTVAISGFPNVGKSTLLRKMTSSTPEVNSYPFTTKQILIGYVKHLHHKVQVLDTPGTLARPEKMNAIEKQAYLAMQYCADLIVYVFDLTLEYPLKDQEKLLKFTRKYGKEVVIYYSKTDLVPPEEIAAHAKGIAPSLEKITGGPEQLKKFLLDRIKL